MLYSTRKNFSNVYCFRVDVLAFVFIFIAGAMTFKILIKVYAGNYFCFGITLSKYNAQVLLLRGIAFQRIRGTGTAAGLALFIVNLPVLQDKFNFLLRNVAALHAAFGMLGIFQESHPPVEPPVAVIIICMYRIVGIRLPAGTAIVIAAFDQQGCHY